MHALHNSFLTMEPPNVKAEENTFYCDPEKRLPDGGVSPILPFCVVLTADSGNKVQQGYAGNDERGPELSKLASYVMQMCMFRGGLELGLYKAKSSYTLTDRSCII
jgi:hypothetical protein